MNTGIINKEVINIILNLQQQQNEIMHKERDAWFWSHGPMP